MSVEWRDMVTEKLYDKEKALYRRSGGCVLSSSSSTTTSSSSTLFGSSLNTWSSSLSLFPMVGDVAGGGGGGGGACAQQRGGGGGGGAGGFGVGRRGGSGWGNCGGGAVIEPAFPNLTRLKLTELLACTDEYLQSLIDECPALTSLDLHWGNPYETEDETRHEQLVMNVVIDAPHLTDLRFAFAAYEEFHKCCLSLTTPKLRSLHVCADNEQALDVNLWKGCESLQSLDLSCHTVRLRFGLQPFHSSFRRLSSSTASASSSSSSASPNPSSRSTYLHLLYPLCSGLTEIKLRGWQWFGAKDLIFSNIDTLRHLHILAGANGPGDFFPEEVRPAEISLDDLVQRSALLRSLCIDLPGLRSVQEKMDGGTAVWEELGALCLQVEEADQRTSAEIDKVVRRCPRVKRVKVVTASDGGLSYMKRQYDLEDGTYKRFLSTEEEREGGRRSGSEAGVREGVEVRGQDRKQEQSTTQHMMCQLRRQFSNAPVQVEII
ncbi:hypothetical protein CBR_g2962 [Chara braunii]|uniref:FBD domain-containing protein n=1 Tax=Chara braunii TaxID=69332 RepID=A0A388KED8_CHABU|nr:hypothetical protein CBR_g2962 [Chara braunii]|eukprot:GBG68418.1 hypothetical protein CBR_g2962 [Chara braunii]